MKIKNLALIILALMIINLTGICVYSEPDPESVTEEDIEAYLEYFYNTFYQELENTYGFNYSRILGFNITYKIYATVSRTHGLAIELVPNDREVLQFYTTEERIEKAIFPDLDFNVENIPEWGEGTITWGGEPEGIIIPIGDLHDIVIKGGAIITKSGNFIELGPRGEVYLFGITVDARYYHAIFLRGSNTIGYWSQAQAEKDAKKIFNHITFSNYNETRQIKKYRAYQIFVDMLSKLLWKQNNALAIGFDLTQFNEEMNIIKELAVNTYHLESSYVSEIFEWLEKITPKPIELPEPPWYQVPPWDWILGAIVGMIILQLVTWLWSKRKSKKRT